MILIGLDFEYPDISVIDVNSNSVENEQNLSGGCEDYGIDYSIYHNLSTKHHILKTQRNCLYCGAKKFQYEFPTFCCMNGKVNLVHPTVPDELYQLFTSHSSESTQFRSNIRKYNNHFSFTSMGVRLDKDCASMRGGIYTFRAQGQIYRFLDQLVPKEDGPKYMQLYFYDTDYDVNHRLRRTSYLDDKIVSKLVRILSINPYVASLRSLGDIGTLDNYRITLTLSTSVELDQRVYNAPTASQVAAIWVEGNGCPQLYKRSIVIYDRSNYTHFIQPYYGCYDPLSYPLLFPNGEPGWQTDIPISGERTSSTNYVDCSSITTLTSEQSENIIIDDNEGD